MIDLCQGQLSQVCGGLEPVEVAVSIAAVAVFGIAGLGWCMYRYGPELVGNTAAGIDHAANGQTRNRMIQEQLGAGNVNAVQLVPGAIPDSPLPGPTNHLE